jgi:hypothetical protein
LIYSKANLDIFFYFLELISLLNTSAVGSFAGLPDGLFSNQKSQIWVNFGGPWNGKCWYIL